MTAEHSVVYYSPSQRDGRPELKQRRFNKSSLGNGAGRPVPQDG
jgi:hypothetical protein